MFPYGNDQSNINPVNNTPITNLTQGQGQSPSNSDSELNTVLVKLKEFIRKNEFDKFKEIFVKLNDSNISSILYKPIDSNGLLLIHYSIQNERDNISELLSTTMFKLNGLNIGDNVHKYFILF